MKKQILTAFLMLFLKLLPAQYPGGISGGLAVWLKADNGWATASWSNLAPTSSRAFASAPYRNAASTTKINNLTFNFNDAVKFNGDGGFRTTSGFNLSAFYNTTSGVNATTYFVVSDKMNLDLTGNFWSDSFASSGCGANRCNSGFRTSDAQFGNASVNYTLPGTAYTNIGSARRNSSTNRSSYVNGIANTVTTTDSFKDFGSYSFSIGEWPGFYIYDAIPEFIWYKRALSDTEVNRVHSYLALKYGVTLTQTTAQNYTSGNGTVYWNASSAGVFKYNIFGIGRDDSSGLHQRISNSVNNSGTTTTSGSYLTISTNSNFTAANTSVNHPNISTDQNYLVVSDNGGVLNNYTTSISGIPNLRRSSRIWHAQQTGSSISCINYRFNSITNPTSTQKYYLVMADDAALTVNREIIDLTVSSGISTISLKQKTGTANYFTIARMDTSVLTEGTDTPVGVDLTGSSNWKPTSKNGYLELNSVSKPVMITRINGTSSISTPVEGMLVFDISSSSFKLCTGVSSGVGTWRELNNFSYERYCN